jgi:hypothetical protein
MFIDGGGLEAVGLEAAGFRGSGFTGNRLRSIMFRGSRA